MFVTVQSPCSTVSDSKMSSESSKSTEPWIPLENDPAILNSYLEHISSSKFKLLDIISLDDVRANALTGKLIAVIILYPLDADVSKELGKKADSVKFVKQIESNSCATLALINALINFAGSKGEIVDDFETSIECDDPEKAGHKLAAMFRDLHAAFTQGGLGNEPSKQDIQTDLHYVTFINANDRLYELDGRKEGPVDKGPSKQSTFLKDAFAVIKRDFLANLKDEDNRFSCLALVKE